MIFREIVMKKIVGLLIIASIVLSVCSCSAPVEVFDMDFNAFSSVGTDLGGKTVVYATAYSDDTVLGYEIGTEFADLAKEAVNRTEKELNCKLDIVYGGYGFGEIIASAYAGTFLCDILCGNTNSATEAIRAGVITGIKSLGGIIDYNDSEKWGNRKHLFALCYEDDVYGVFPISWPLLTQSQFGYPLVVNEDIVSQLALPDPREYVETDAWTWAQFRKCIEDYTVIESGEVKIYGFSTTESAYVEMFTRSNGDRMVGRDANGEFVFGFSSDSAAAAMEEARDILKGSLSYAVYTALPVPTVEKFDAGEAGMCCTPYIFGKEDFYISKCLNNYALLIYPTGPNAEPGSACSVFSGYGNCITIPVLTHDAEATATVLDKLYEPLTGFETFEKIKEHMSRYYFFDERDCDNFYKLYLSWDNLFNNCNIGSKYKEFITYNGSISSYIESNRESAAEIFDKYVMPAVRGSEAVWGTFEN